MIPEQQDERVYTAPVSTQPKAVQIFAKIISYALHPVFIPTLLALMLYKLAPVGFAGVTQKEFNMWLLSIGITTIFFPLLSVLLMKGLGFIKSIHMYDPKDRIIPLITTMIFYFWASHVFQNIPKVPLVMKVLMLGAFWNVIVLFMVSIFFKISMHATAAGSMIGIIIVHMMISPINMKIPLFIAIAVAGLMGTARLLLNAHKQSEVWLGYALGILVQIAAFWYLK